MKIDAGGTDFAIKGVAELVVADFADVCAAAAERGDANEGVGGGAPGHFDGIFHLAVEFVGPIRLDQGHCAFGEAELGDLGVGHAGQGVDDGVADADDVERWVAGGG